MLVPHLEKDMFLSVWLPFKLLLEPLPFLNSERFDRVILLKDAKEVLLVLSGSSACWMSLSVSVF
jgi:hypothetical protein